MQLNVNHTSNMVFEEYIAPRRAEIPRSSAFSFIGYCFLTTLNVYNVDPNNPNINLPIQLPAEPNLEPNKYLTKHAKQHVKSLSRGFRNLGEVVRAIRVAPPSDTKI